MLLMLFSFPSFSNLKRQKIINLCDYIRESTSTFIYTQKEKGNAEDLNTFSLAFPVTIISYSTKMSIVLFG